jgi:ParB family chromosome partitioning protein
LERKSAADLLTSVDDLFTTQEERDAVKRETVKDIPLSEISDFPDHPFKVRMDEAMAEMAESVKQYGVLVPAMVRPKPEGGYEMIAGHRRKLASELAQKPDMPCIVRELTDDEAIIVMIDSNLQREKILPSEKAFAYKMKLEALKRQGKRTDLTFGPLGQKSQAINTREEIANNASDSARQVQRYIRLTNLIPPLLDMVDEGKIAMRPAVELSYLPESEQVVLQETMEMELCTPSHAQAIKMRKFSEEGKLNEDVILSIMQEEKPNQKEQVRIPRERISKYFAPGTPAQKIEDTIVKALELYRKRQRDMER